MRPTQLSEQRHFRARVYALWKDGMDTSAMSRMLQVPEYECERALHAAVESHRAVKTNLGAAQDA